MYNTIVSFYTIVSFLALVLSFVVGLMVGYTCGEDHATTVAIKAKWEREAREWDERHERLMQKLNVEVDE